MKNQQEQIKELEQAIRENLKIDGIPQELVQKMVGRLRKMKKMHKESGV